MKTEKDGGHSKLPWHTDDDVPERCAIVESDRNRAIAYFTELDCDRANGEANRALVVRRVNSGPAADALAEAVEQAITEMNEDGEGGSCSHPHLTPALAAYKKAQETK